MITSNMHHIIIGHLYILLSTLHRNTTWYLGIYGGGTIELLSIVVISLSFYKNPFKLIWMYHIMQHQPIHKNCPDKADRKHKKRHHVGTEYLPYCSDFTDFNCRILFLLNVPKVHIKIDTVYNSNIIASIFLPAVRNNSAQKIGIGDNNNPIVRPTYRQAAKRAGSFFLK